MLFTQNIDCLEREAGVPGDLIVEAHGSFAKQRCIECKTEYPDGLMKEHVFKGQVPRCTDKKCNGLVKPDIVFFGEALPESFYHNRHVPGQADMAFIMGTSLTVHPFAGLPDLIKEDCPRVLFNMERVGSLGTMADDVLVLGDCDSGVRKLAEELGWADELEAEWRRVVGEKEAARQLRSAEDRQAELHDEVEDLAEKVGAGLKIKDGPGDNEGAAGSRAEGDTTPSAVENAETTQESTSSTASKSEAVTANTVQSGEESHTPPKTDSGASSNEATTSDTSSGSANQAGIDTKKAGISQQHSDDVLPKHDGEAIGKPAL